MVDNSDYERGRGVARRAAALAAEPPSGSVAVGLERIEAAAVSLDARLDLLIGWDRVVSYATARVQALLVSLGPGDVDPADDAVPELVATALRLAPRTAQNRVHAARTLLARLPAVHDAELTGHLSPAQVQAFLDVTHDLDDQTAAAVTARVLPRAHEKSVAQTRQALRRARIAADSRSAAERHERAREERVVRLTPAENGMAELWALLPAEDADAVMRAVRGVADRDRVPSDPRTGDQRLADALAAMGYAYLDAGTLPTSHGRVPHLQLTAAASTLAGDDDQPCELAGYGPITAQQARRLLARYDDGVAGDAQPGGRTAIGDAQPGGTGTTGGARPGPGAAAACAKPRASGSATMYLVDEQGQLTGQPPPETPGYRPGRALRDWVIRRDRRCTFPFCGMPAERCDLDHLHPRSSGGRTAADNLHPLCRRHHRAKHRHGWQVRRDASGGYRWTSPTGRTYVERPPAYPVPGSGPPGHPSQLATR